MATTRKSRKQFPKRSKPVPQKPEPVPPGATRKVANEPLNPEGGAPGSGAGPRHAAADPGSPNESYGATDSNEPITIYFVPGRRRKQRRMALSSSPLARFSS